MEAFAGAPRQPVRRRDEAWTTCRSAPPDERIAARIDGADVRRAEKTAALRAHATQIPADSWLFTLAGNFGAEFMGVEYYQLVHGERGPGDGPDGWESDLFAGLDVAGPAIAGPHSPAQQSRPSCRRPSCRGPGYRRPDVAGPAAARPAAAGSGAAGPDVTG